jgi:hypothetical protein
MITSDMRKPIPKTLHEILKFNYSFFYEDQYFDHNPASDIFYDVLEEWMK